MKRIILFYTLFILSLHLLAQENFYWEAIDSTSKTKDQIYSATKVFIAETWKSAQDVIQNDDKEGGIIIIKAVSIQKESFMMGTYRYIYNYTVSFQMKDKKYRLILKDVYCESAEMTSSTKNPYVAKIQPFDGDNCPPTGTFAEPGLPKNKAIPMMAEFKLELQSIVDSYIIHMAQSEVVDDEKW